MSMTLKRGKLTSRPKVEDSRISFFCSLDEKRVVTMRERGGKEGGSWEEGL